MFNSVPYTQQIHKIMLSKNMYLALIMLSNPFGKLFRISFDLSMTVPVVVIIIISFCRGQSETSYVVCDSTHQTLGCISIIWRDP